MTKIRFLLAASLSVILLLAGVTLWKTLQKPSLSSGASKPVLEAKQSYEQRIKTDQENLKKEKATDPEIFGALVRLAQRRDPEARTEALKRVASRSPLVREGVANALGYFEDPEAMAALKHMLEDPEKKVRRQAINALSHVANEDREKLIRETMDKPSLETEERLAALRGLVKISKAPEARARAVDSLVKFANESKDPRALEQAMISAISLAPGAAGTLALLREKLPTLKTPGVAAAAIRHLAAQKDPWLLTSLPKFQSSDEQTIRLAVIQTIHMTCPGNRWAFIEKSLADKSSAVSLAAQQALFFMNGEKAQSLLSGAIESRKLPAGTEERAKRLLENLKKNSGQDRCLASAEPRRQFPDGKPKR